jgi:hypothetical protein
VRKAKDLKQLQTNYKKNRSRTQSAEAGINPKFLLPFTAPAPQVF